jgi:glycosyltransferase involved in cell wall biosynthesis
VPVWNGDRFLAEALDSIVPPHQTAIEVLVVDDGSTDRSAAIAAARAPLIRVIHQEHAGLPRARNRALREARGALLAFLDSDDKWSPDKLALQISLLDRRPDITIALGHTRRTWPSSGPGAMPGEFTPGEAELALSLGASLVRREAFDRVGRFDESYTHSDDWDWFMRAREMGVPIGAHAEVVLFYRRHEGNMTNDTSAGNHFFARMLRRSVERRRAGITAPLPALIPLD